MADIPAPEPPLTRTPPLEPLRFALSFIEGRALIGFDARPLTPWLRVHDFRMEIPDVRFPFDVSGGAERFRHRRCRLVALAFEVDERGFVDWLQERLAAHLAPLADLEVAFGRGFIEVGGTVPAGDFDPAGRPTGAADRRVPFSVRLGVDAGEDPPLRLVLHDVRLYASAALPAPAVGLALLQALASADLPVEVAPPAALHLDPVPRLLRGLLPRHGWKLPEMEGVRLTAAEVAPGRARLVFSPAAVAGGPARSAPGLLSTLEGARAFADGEAAVAGGDWAGARAAWLALAGPLPDHPFAAERLLSLMVSDPARREAAADLADALLARDPTHAAALWVRALVPPAGGEVEGFLRLAQAARDEGERIGARMAAEAAAEAAERAGDDRAARSAWETVLELAPTRTTALRALMTLHARAGDTRAAARAGERLLDLVSAEVRAEVHTALGKLLMDAAPGEVSRARLHFDAALRLDPRREEAWEGLGEACREDEPLRAVRALEKARGLLIGAGTTARAAALSRRIAALWDTRLGHPENALLRYRESLEAAPEDPETLSAVGRLCLRLGRLDEAEHRLEAALRLSEAAPGLAAVAREAHLGLAEVARRRDDREREAAHLSSAGGSEETPSARRTRLSALVEALAATRAPRPHADALAELAEVCPEPEAAAAHLATSAEILLQCGGPIDIARARLAEARRLDPDGLRPLEVLVGLEGRHGDAGRRASVLEALARRRTDPAARARAWLDLGLLMEDEGELERALGALGEAVQADPEGARREAVAATLRVARRWGRPAPLADALSRAAELAPAEEAAELCLEEARVRERRLEDVPGAIRALEAARRVGPDDPRVLWALGRLVLAQENPRTAHDLFLDLQAVGGPEAAGVAPAEAARLMGAAAEGAGEDFAAAVHLTRVLEEDADDRDAFERADALLARLERPAERARLARLVADRRAEAGDDEGAVRLWARASELGADTDPKAARHAAERALALWCPPRLVHEALRARAEEAAVPQAPWPEEAIALAEHLGRLADSAKDAGASLRAAEILAVTDADDPGGRLVAAGAGLDPDDPRGLETLELAVRLAPAEVGRRRLLAERLAEIDPEEALAHYEVLLGGSDPRDAHHGTDRRRAADLALAAGDAGRARHHLGLHLALSPGDRESLARYAGLLREANAQEALYEVLLQLAAVTPEAAAAADLLVEAAALARDGLERPEAARAALEGALERRADHRPALLRLSDLLPEDDLEGLARIHDQLAEGAEGPPAAAHRTAQGRALLALGEATAASTAFEQAIALDPEARDAAEGLAEAAWACGDLLGFMEALPRAARLALSEGTSDGPVRAVVAAVLLLDQGGDPAEARVLLDAALADDEALPRDWRIEALERRRALRGPAERDGEIEDLSRLLSVLGSDRPNRTAALHRRRARLRDTTDPEGAREDWTAVHRLDPRDPEPVAELLRHAEASGDAPALAALWRTEAERRLAAGDRAGAGRAWSERAAILAREPADLDGAGRALERAVDLAGDAPSTLRALDDLRTNLIARGRVDAAFRVALREADVAPAEAVARLLEASARARDAGRRGVALELLRNAWQREPRDVRVAAPLLEALFLEGAVAESEPPARLIATTSTDDLAEALDRGATEARRLRWLAACALVEIEPAAAAATAEGLLEEAPAWQAPLRVLLELHRDDPDALTQRVERQREATRHPERRRRLAGRLADLAAVRDLPKAEAEWLEASRADDSESLVRRMDAWRRSGNAAAYAETAASLLQTSDPTDGRDRLGEVVRVLAEELEAPDIASDLMQRAGGHLDDRESWWTRARLAQRVGDAAGRLEALRALARHADADGEVDEATRLHAEVARLTSEAGESAAAGGEWLEVLSRTPEPALVREAAAWAEAAHVPEVEATALRLLAEADADAAPDLLTRLADILQQGLGKVDEAERALREALARRGDHRHAFDALVALLADQGRHLDLATECRARAARVPDEAAALRLEAARHALAEGRPEAAVEDLEAARDADALGFQHANGSTRLDEARALAGRHADRAWERMEQAQGRPQEEAATLRREAALLLIDELGDWPEGRAALMAASEAGDAEATERLQLELAARGEGAALGHLHKRLSEGAATSAGRLEHLLLAADAFGAAGLDAEASACFDAAFDDAPTDPRALEARLARNADRPEEAAAALERYLARAPETAPDRAVRLAALARAQEAAGRPAAALESWESLLVLQEDDPTALVAAARLSAAEAPERARPFDRRLEQLASAGVEIPRDALLDARIRLGKHALEERRLPEALFHLEAALERGPGAAEPLVEAARLARRPDLVARAWDRLGEDAEGEARVRALLRSAEAWERMGAFDAALGRWQAAFDLDPASVEACRALEAAALGRGDPAARLRVLERHAGALTDPAARHAALLGVVEAAERLGESHRRDRAAREAFALAGDDPETARLALPVLRDGSPADLARALEVVAAAAEPENAGALYEEAAAAYDRAGDASAAAEARRAARALRPSTRAAVSLAPPAAEAPPAVPDAAAPLVAERVPAIPAEAPPVAESSPAVADAGPPAEDLAPFAAATPDSADAPHAIAPEKDSRTAETQPAERPEFLRDFDRGEEALRAGQPDEALEAFRSAVGRNPAFLPAWRAAATAAEQLGRPGARAEALEGALAALPEDATEERYELLVALAAQAHRRLRTEEAVRWYAQALTLAPVAREVLEPLAGLHEDGGRLGEAAELWQRLADVYGGGRDAARAHLRAARLLADGLGRADEALPHVEAATREAPDDAGAWRLRLELTAPRGEPEPLVACVEALGRLGRRDAVAPWALEAGRALRACAADPGEAAGWLLEAARARPQDRALAGEAAAALVQARRPEDARVLLAELAASTGDPADARAAAEAALWAGDRSGWLERLSVPGVVDDLPPSSGVCLLRALAVEAAERPSTVDAAALLDRAVALDPANPLYADRARILEASGDAAGARALWLAAARGDPGDRAARAGLARTGDAEPRSRLAAAAAAWLGGEAAPAAELDPATRRLSDGVLRRLAAPPAAGPVARLLAAMAPALEPLFPADPARFGADVSRPLPPDAHPLAARLEAWTRALEGRPLRLLSGPRLGAATWLENTRPLSWVVGPDILEADPRTQDQLLIRAVVLARLGYALPGKFSGNDLQVLVRLALSFFNGAVQVPIPPDKVRQYHAAMGRLVTPERRERLAGLAAEAAGALSGFDSAALAPALRRTADRVALVVSGDLGESLEAVLRQERLWALVGAGRAEQVRAHPALGELLTFALDDGFDACWREVRRAAAPA